ncbi:MAG: hypothetical protein GX974_05065 [Clostridiales bacterium]|nr:hypothetical protein [Clostridiales bacterium]
MSNKDKLKTCDPIIAGICTLLIATSSLKLGAFMAIFSCIIMVITNLFMHIFKDRIPNDNLTIFYVSFSAFLSGLMNLIIQAYMPEMFDEIGLYIPIIIFCTSIVVHMLYDDHLYSITRSLKTSMGIIISVAILSTLRQIIGLGLPNTLAYPTTFIIVAILFAIASGITSRINVKQ